ncbi:unnamed protein product [Lupinus luteus]|uniref:Uncharacterized protein n=1 Tax=Lupinus luteus TaxID=3873 RepID=A0AAV1YFK4_LUPLU
MKESESIHVEKNLIEGPNANQGEIVDSSRISPPKECMWKVGLVKLETGVKLQCRGHNTISGTSSCYVIERTSSMNFLKNATKHTLITKDFTTQLFETMWYIINFGTPYSTCHGTSSLKEPPNTCNLLLEIMSSIDDPIIYSN